MATSPFHGSWRITHMDQWDEDFVDLVVPGFIRFDGTAGEFAFGAVASEMHCIVGRRDSAPIVEWTWAGRDEEDQSSGRGWARLDGKDKLSGISSSTWATTPLSRRRAPERVDRS